MSRRVRLVSDGTGPGTHIFGADGVEFAAHVAEVTWSVTADHLSRATVTLVNVEAELIGEVQP